MGRNLLTLADGELFALANAYAVDGSVSWHDPDARGYAPMNCYVLVEGNASLLLDSGLTIHREVIFEQLRQCLPAAAKLEIVALRLGEFDSVMNLIPLVSGFDVDVVYGSFDDPLAWADVQPDDRLADHAHEPRFQRVRARTLHSRDTIGFGSRHLDVFFPALRLLSTFWVYDQATATLFTSDVFGHVVRATEDGPWTVTADADDTTEDEVRGHLLGGRYWWLSGARTDKIRRDLAATFDKYDVRRIAPAYGCILEGPDVVSRHYGMLDAVLAAVGRERRGSEAVSAS